MIFQLFKTACVLASLTALGASLVDKAARGKKFPVFVPKAVKADTGENQDDEAVYGAERRTGVLLGECLRDLETCNNYLRNTSDCLERALNIAEHYSGIVEKYFVPLDLLEKIYGK